MARANPVRIQKLLSGLQYPARKAALIEYALRKGADRQVQSILERLPDRQYERPVDVNEALNLVD